MTTRSLTRPRFAALLASFALVAGTIALSSTSLPAAHADEPAAHPTVTLTPSSGTADDLGPAGADKFTLSTDLVCPAGAGLGLVLTAPAISAPLVLPDELQNFQILYDTGATANAWIDYGTVLIPIVADVNGHIPDTTNLFPGVGDASSGNAWGSGSDYLPYLQSWVTPNTDYSLIAICADATTGLRAIPDSEHGNQAYEAWSTLHVHGDGSWTLGGADTPPTDDPTAVDSQVAVGATLSASGNTADLAATVSKTGDTAAATDATGSVQFYEGGTPIAGGSVAVSAGLATLTSPTLSAGDHSFTAKYLPDAAGAALYKASAMSAPSPTVTVAGDPTGEKQDSSVALAGDVSGTDGAAFAATVKKTDGSTATDAAGTIEFWAGETKAGEGAVTQGVASFAKTGLPAGQDYGIKAKYVPSADALYNASESEVVTVTVPENQDEPEALAENGTVDAGKSYVVTAPAGTFDDGDTIAGEVHSDPIALSETATASADGGASYTFTIPNSLKAGEAHELLLTGSPSNKTYTVHFTVSGTAPAGPAGSNNPVTFATDWVAAAATTPSGIASLFGIALGLVAAMLGAWLLLWRRRSNGSDA